MSDINVKVIVRFSCKMKHLSDISRTKQLQKWVMEESFCVCFLFVFSITYVFVFGVLTPSHYRLVRKTLDI